MTPKEKANELVDKYVSLTDGWVYGISSWEYKKKCALVAVDEIRNILSMPNIPKYYPIVTDEYWEQVKQEIEKL
jgi:hypothetical protein